MENKKRKTKEEEEDNGVNMTLILSIVALSSQIIYAYRQIIPSLVLASL